MHKNDLRFYNYIAIHQVDHFIKYQLLRTYSSDILSKHKS